MELHAIAAQLNIVNGEPQDGRMAAGLLSQTSQSRSTRLRRRDSLFVHLSLSGPPEETRNISEEIVDSVSNIFYRTTGSVTAALRKSIIETNQLLLQYNLSQGNKPLDGAIVCAALRGDELFSAQVGEAISFIGHNFGIERLPPAAPDVITPFGRSIGLDIRFYHHRLQPGDSLLLADPRMSHLSTNALEPALIEYNIEEGVELLTDLIGDNTSQAILVEFSDEVPDDLPAAFFNPARAGHRSPRPQIAGAVSSSSKGSIQNIVEVHAVGTAIDIDYIETKARLATSKAAGRVSKAAGGLAAVLSTVKSTSSENDTGSSWTFPTYFAVIIPLVVGLLVAGVYIQRGQVLYVGQLRSQIDEYLSLASQAGDDTQDLAYYYGEALQLLDESQELRPGDDELLQMRLQVQASLDSLQGVSRLGAHVYKTFDKDSRLASIAVADEEEGNLFVLDENSNSLYSISTNETNAGPVQIIVGDQAVGTHIVGPMIDMVWRAKGKSVTRDGIAVLDGRGSLVTYYPNFADTRAVDMELSTEWVQPSVINTFNERLYVLDKGMNKIWRYYADGDGFTIGENQQFLEFEEDPQLEKVIDFTIINEDGSVVLLYEDGRLRRYANGFVLWDESDVIANGLISPMESPTAVKIAGSGLNSSIFVSDPGSGRIIQFSLGGTYLAQYRATSENGLELFSTIPDFAVLNNPLRIYSLANNQVYLASLE